MYSIREYGSTAQNPWLQDVNKVLTKISQDVKNLWNRASLFQTITDIAIRNKIKRSYERYKKICKAFKAGKSSKMVDEFQKDMQKLFDICLCKCQVTNMQEVRGKLLCNCIEKNRILINEFNFLLDQRGERKLHIGKSIDRKCSKKYITSEIRKQKQTTGQREDREIASTSYMSSFERNESELLPRKRPTITYIEDAEDDLEAGDDEDFKFVAKYVPKAKKCPITPCMVAGADAKNVSVRAQAQQVNGTLEAVSLSSPKVSASKVWRIREKYRQNAAVSENKNIKVSKSIQVGFDGKVINKMDRYVFNGIYNSNGKRKDTLIKIKTFSRSANARMVTEQIIEMDQEILKNVKVLIADTTSINTGCNSGVFKRVKQYFIENFNRDVHVVECLMHTIELLFKHFFLTIEGPSQSAKTLKANTVYNMIGKMNIDGDKNIPKKYMLLVPNKIESELNYYLQSNTKGNATTKEKLRDDQMCLLVWTAKAVGLLIPEELKKFLNYKQESHGLARWLTTACGYLRIYGTVCNTTVIDKRQHQHLKIICQFIVSVYTPAWLRIFYNPSIPEGPGIMLDIRNNLLDAADLYCIPTATMQQMQKIFTSHGMAWLSKENIALSVLSPNNSLTVEKVSEVNHSLDEITRRSMLWNKKFKLVDFLSCESKQAPCLSEADADADFWKVTMSSNRSCERYIGQMKNILEGKQIRDDKDIDHRIKNMINLQDKTNWEGRKV